MTIREEMKQIGFSDNEIDQFVYEVYENEKRNATSEKERFQNKMTSLSIENLIYRFFKRLAYKRYIEKKDNNIPEFAGDRNNPIEVYEYNSRYGIMPVETIHNEDGTYTHIYEDGTEVTIKVTLTGIPIPSDERLKKLETDNRRLLAEVLNITEQEAINMKDSQVKRMVLKREKINKKFLFTKS